ncbi:hypothetical protein PVAG01_06879 [Phlyctema vagabunda]|uniref:Uncharacterized protein n=1 Tax=Phlyctema vagabunda TaxID=108571 RepID=A0ABR4PHJ8_9HELO
MSIDDHARWYPEVIHVMAIVWTKIMLLAGMTFTARELQRELLSLDDILIWRARGEWPMRAHTLTAVRRVERWFWERQIYLDHMGTAAVNVLKEQGMLPGSAATAITADEFLFLLNFIETNQGYRFVDMSLLPTDKDVLNRFPWEDMYRSIRFQEREYEISSISKVLISIVGVSVSEEQKNSMVEWAKDNEGRVDFVGRWRRR